MERGSDRSLFELALAPLRGRDDIAVLVAAIPLDALLEAPGVERIDALGAAATVDDPRVRRHDVELGLFLKQVRLGAAQGPEGGWLAVIVDDPAFFEEAGLEKLETALRPGGVIALRSQRRDPELVRRLHARFQHVAEVAVPVELESGPSLDYVYRGRRAGAPRETTKAN